MTKWKAAVLTISDKGYQGAREDISGKTATEYLLRYGYDVCFQEILPDEREMISEKLEELCAQKVHIVITSGGTGFSKRDVTPEATLDVIERRADGISQAMLYHSLSITPRAMLSRGVAGIKDETLIINLPGSPKAVKEDLEYILPVLAHGLEVLHHMTGDCSI